MSGLKSGDLPSPALRSRVRCHSDAVIFHSRPETLDDYTLIIAFRYNFYEFLVYGIFFPTFAIHPIRHNHASSFVT